MKGQIYEGGTRVPGLIEWPARIPTTFVSAVPCSTLDIYPTVLAATGTTGFANRPVTVLSGGERARVLMARVLAGEPQWILADEPLANLDPGYQLDMLGLLRAQADNGKGVVAVLHDLHHAVRFADHVVLLHEGRVYAQGDAASVIIPQHLADVYGIDATLTEGEDGGYQLHIKGKI